jgi:hypothetical protein
MNDTTPDRGHNNPPELLPVLPPPIDDEVAKQNIADTLSIEEELPYDPVIHESLRLNVSAFCDAAGAWADLGKITTPAQSERLTDFVAGARGLYKKTDEARKKAKSIHDARAAAVQRAFAPLLEKLERVATTMKAMQTDWLQREEARIAAEKRAAEEEAEQKRRDAEAAAAQAAARNDISGQVDAEAALKEAEEQAAAAARTEKARAGSATGGGRTMALRTQAYAEVENWRAVFMHFEDRQEVKDVLQRLADAAIRGGETVPGAKRAERKVAA